MTRLVLLWIVLAAAAAGLDFWDRALDRGEVAARDVRYRIGRLIRAEERAAIAPADARDVEPEPQRYARTPVSVGRVGEPKFLYRPDDEGVFRCPNVFDTIADEAAIDALRKALLEAEGVVVSRAADEATDYGFDLPHTVEVSLHGPAATLGGDLDVRFTVQLGHRRPDGKGCYVRRFDDPGVWAIGTDPWAPLAQQDLGRPPLLDPHVVPRVWPGESRRVDRQEVLFADGESYAITLHDIEITEEEMRRGKSPYEWHLHAGGEERLANPQSAVMWSSFLFFAPWSVLIDPAQTGALGFDDPLVRIVLTPATGEPCELRVSKRPLPSGEWPILNTATDAVFGITTEVRDLMAPKVDVFDEAYEENPWRPYLQRR